MVAPPQIELNEVSSTELSIPGNVSPMVRSPTCSIDPNGRSRNLSALCITVASSVAGTIGDPNTTNCFNTAPFTANP